MLDFVSIFTRGGINLWSSNQSYHEFMPCVNHLIRDVILEERSTISNTFVYENYALQYKADNDLDLFYVVIYQKVLNLPYINKVLDGLDHMFKTKFEEILDSKQRRTYHYNFDHDFRKILLIAENSVNESKVPKQMRSYNDSIKSKKTMASLMESKDLKKINIQEKQVATDLMATGLSNEDVILENRKKLIEKMSKKSPLSKNRNSAEKDKAGKKPRVWDLGGNTKDAASLDRSKDAPEFVFQKKLQSDIVGTMQGGVKDLEVESDIDGSDNSVSEETVDVSNKKLSGIMSYFKGIVGSKTLSRKEMQEALDKMREHLISKNVASDIASKLCESVATNLEGKSIGTFDSIISCVKKAIDSSLVQILSPKRRIDILRDALESKKLGKPYTIIFCGVNGVGKSTNLAKICFWLIENNFSVLIAACDTFRAGAVEQLRTHTRHLNALHPPENHNNRIMVQLYEKGYGKDAAGIALEAIKFAHDSLIDVVLVDTAGRMQDNEPLMRSLSKLIKVNTPDLVLFVGEALVGNEAVDQLVKFNQALADFSFDENPHLIDGIVLTKFDTIDDKVGAAISMTYITGQPIAFVGTGQTYSDLKALNVKAVVHSLMK